MNREELVEAMARAIFDAEYRDVDPLDRDIEWTIVKSADYSRERGTVWHHQAAAALPVALDAILGPVEALHRRVANPVPNSITVHLCAADRDFYPCPTRRACDQIRAEYGGGQ